MRESSAPSWVVTVPAKSGSSPSAAASSLRVSSAVGAESTTFAIRASTAVLKSEIVDAVWVPV